MPEHDKTTDAAFLQRPTDEPAAPPTVPPRPPATGAAPTDPEHPPYAGRYRVDRLLGDRKRDRREG
jgi:hypothetical protein